MRVEPIIYFECLMLCLVILIVLFIANIRYWRPVIFNRLSLIYVFTAITIGFYAARTFMEGHPEYALINKLLVVGSSLFMTLSCMFYYYYVLKNVGVTYKNGKFWYLSSVLAILGSTALNGQWKKMQILSSLMKLVLVTKSIWHICPLRWSMVVVKVLSS